MKIIVQIPFLSKEINKYLQIYFNKITDAIGLTSSNITIEELINSYGELPRNNFYITDAGKEGNWYYDENDTTSIDNVGTVIVTKDGKRIKRRIDNYIYPQWFGVLGTGVVDESVNLRKAILASTQLKKPLYFRDGVYLCSNLDFSGLTYLHLIGGGTSSIIRCMYGANKTILKLRSSSNITIEYLQFDGNKTNQTTTETPDVNENNINDNIYISRGSNINIHHTTQVNSRGNGINIYKGVGFHIDYNYIKDCNAIDQNGITALYGFTDQTVRDNGGSISNNYIINNALGMGLSCFASHEIVVANNTIKNCIVGIGLEYAGSKNTVINNTVIGAGKGMSITGTLSFAAFGEYNNVSNNKFLKCTGLSVAAVTGLMQITAQKYLIFDNNIVTGESGNTVPGLHITGVSYSTFSKNKISGAGNLGISFVSSASSNIVNKVIFNDIFENNAGGVFAQGINRTEFIGNKVFDNIGSGFNLSASSKLLISNNAFSNIIGTNQTYAIIFNNCLEITEGVNTFSFLSANPDVNIIGTISAHQVTERINYARSFGTAAPTTGTWGIHDKVKNTNMTSGQVIQWKCVVAGSPGTWVSMGTYI